MSLTVERMAVADRAIRQTFERASVAWRAVPHWDTGDPGQARVRNDLTAAPGDGPLGSEVLPIVTEVVPFRMTLAQAIAATPDALLAAVVARTTTLAAQFDAAVLTAVAANRPTEPLGDDPTSMLTALILGRRSLEDGGYRAPSCLIAGTAPFTDFHQLVNGRSVLGGLLAGAGAVALHRASALDDPPRTIMLGRRQDIPADRVGQASAGEEPVDIAVAVAPGLEVVGEDAANEITMGVRLRYAVRVKDPAGVVVFAPRSRRRTAA